MSSGVRLLLASIQRDMVSAIKNGMESKPFIESVVSVAFPTDAERKLTKIGQNVLIWDLDEFGPNHTWSRNAEGKYSIYIIYTSVASARYKLVPQSGRCVFLQKPAIFTPVTTARYLTSISQEINTMAKERRPPNMRDLNKMVSVNDRQKIVAIGSSTGGTNALEDLLKQLPPNIPPMLVVQHMPSGFTKLFADRLNALYPQEIKEAQTGDFLMHGRMLIAPADRHMKLIKQQGKLAVDCYVGSRIHGVMPAADVLFESIAQTIGNAAVGIILTGMGSDGAKGLLQMKNVGCVNVGQNEATCVVYGMPKAAKDIGALTEVLPLDRIPEAILRLANV